MQVARRGVRDATVEDGREGADAVDAGLTPRRRSTIFGNERRCFVSSSDPSRSVRGPSMLLPLQSLAASFLVAASARISGADRVVHRPRRWRRALGMVPAAVIAAGLASLPAAVRAGEAATASNASVAVSAVAVGGDETATTISIDLTRPVPIGVFGLAAPDRLVIDLPGARFDLPRDAGAGARGLVRQWRFGAFAADRSRLVFDLARPVRLTGADLQAADGTRPTRMVVALGAAGPDEAPWRPVHLGPPEPPRTADTARPAPATTAGKRVIVVDAGHGGVDAGTVSPATGTPEKTVVLEMAKVLARRLEETGRYAVRMTRQSDVFVGLDARVDVARAARADLFLSIHADAEYDHSVRGATVYTVAEKASDARAAALAAKENRSDAIAGLIEEAARDDVTDILADLTRRESRRFSRDLARDILAEYARNGRLVKGAAHREAGLKVLRAHDFPSVLVEIGFLSNPEDEKQMASVDWRDHTAGSLIAAIDRWFSERGSAVSAGAATGRAPVSP